MRVFLLTAFSSLALASIPPLLHNTVVKRQSSGDCGSSLSPCGVDDCYDPSTEVCCSAYSVHCPSYEYCTTGDDGQPGCCPNGESCSGGGGVVTTGTIIPTGTSTPTVTRTPVAGTFTRTTPTSTTTTDDQLSSIQASVSSELASISRSAASAVSSISSRASSATASTTAATSSQAAANGGAMATAHQYAAVGLFAALVLA